MAALKKKNQEFAEKMADVSDEELILYLRNCAEKLGYSPCMSEIIGGAYIAARFGGWPCAIAAAGLKRPGRAPAIRKRKIYKEEYKRQMHLLKIESKERKEMKKQERDLRQQESRARKEERKQKDMIWGKAHEQLSDEELLDHVRAKAKELGYTPFAREVEGGEYIAERFCGWPVVLTLAELPLPRGMKPPKAVKMAEYSRKKPGGSYESEKN